MIDYHVHERRSRDASTALIPGYIVQAEARGVHEICFTNHFITIGPDVAISIKEEEIAGYIEDVHKARETTKIRLLAGLEVDFFPGEERHIEKLLDDHDLDFVLGSTHYINGVDIGSQMQAKGYFNGRRIREAADEYYSTWRRAIETGLFDVMAHPDYWRKYLHFFGKSAPWGEYGSNVFEALQSAADNEVGIEVNTAGERAGTGHFYPIQEFLVAAYEAGLKNVTVGSDSHTAGTLGYRLEEAARMLSVAGFKEMSSFEKRRSRRTPIAEMLRRTR